MVHTPALRRALLRRHLTSFRLSQVPHRFTDLLVLGSGIAGLSASLSASEVEDTEVLLIAKDALDETGTQYAQGGIVSVVDPEATGDSIEDHIRDTLEVASGLGNEEAIRVTATDGIVRVRELIDRGVPFDRTPEGRIHFALEGGHSRPRILHTGDSTGKEIQRVLLEAVRSRPHITTLPRTFAVDLLTRDGKVLGAVLCRPNGEVQVAWAKRTVLATGGAGRLFRETTNPRVSTGDGVSMAFRAGAILQDLEFVQFHPTTLYLAGADRFLITEAVRGAGGALRDGDGNRFMDRYHPLGDLAPRDVVSRGILRTLRERDENKVFLDLSAIPPETIQTRFPRILEILRGFGIDILKEPIPVRPSAHYFVGGVQTDLLGRTTLPGLFAAGEVAVTGLHGANRLASNSLLEGLVFGHRAGAEAAREARGVAMPSPSSLDGRLPDLAPKPAGLDLVDLSSSLRSLVWQKVGLERNGSDLEAALRQIESWIPYVLGSNFNEVESWTIQNMLLTAHLMTHAALRRTESRGVHFRSDFPERNDAEWTRHLTISREDIAVS